MVLPTQCGVWCQRLTLLEQEQHVSRITSCDDPVLWCDDLARMMAPVNERQKVGLHVASPLTKDDMAHRMLAWRANFQQFSAVSGVFFRRR
jgi:hypothetical protein